MSAKMSMMTKYPLVQAVHISDTSVYLLPKKGPIDFGTLSRAPPIHRTVLQKNGLIAKVFISAVFSDDRTASAQLTEAGRRDLWLRALQHARVVADKTDAIEVDEPFAGIRWPVLSPQNFAVRMAYLNARRETEDVNTSKYCVPILDLQHAVYNSAGVKVSVGVVWMPRYSTNLERWAEVQMQEKNRPPPQIRMTNMLQHVTVGLGALSRMILPNAEGDSTPDITTLYGCPAMFKVDNVVVNEEDRNVIFSITVSHMSMTDEQRSRIAAVAANSFAELYQMPYLAPEQLAPPGSMVIPHPKFGMWALGAIAFQIGRGTPTLESQRKHESRYKAEMPLNHPKITPDTIISRLRRDLQPCGYSSGFIGLVGLLLSQDHLTRPSLRLFESILIDLDRSIPVHRYPFAIGDLSLLRVPAPENIKMNPSARKYVTNDVCCYCGKRRSKTSCKGENHVPAVASGPWDGDELLPGLPASAGTVMSYLYPLVPRSVEERGLQRLLIHNILGRQTSSARHRVASARGGMAGGTPAPPEELYAALGSVHDPTSGRQTPTATTPVGKDDPTINRTMLLQLFGGFAMYKKPSRPKEGAAAKKDRAVVTDVLVPFPRGALRKGEKPWVAANLGFTPALPWVSFCTKALQKKGRVFSQIPAFFGGYPVNPADENTPAYFAWITPGEVFLLESGRKWTPAPEGGFVLWFNKDLSPSEMDRYYAVTSVRSCTMEARMVQTLPPGQVFRSHILNEPIHISLTIHGADSSRISRHLSSRRQSVMHGSLTSPTRSAQRRRGSQSAMLIEVPHEKAIQEDDGAVAPVCRSRTQSRAPSPRKRDDSLTEEAVPRRDRVVPLSEDNICTLRSDENRSRADVRRRFGDKAVSNCTSVSLGESGEVSPGVSSGRRTRRTRSPAQRKGRQDAMKLTALDDLDCASPIYEHDKGGDNQENGGSGAEGQQAGGSDWRRSAATTMIERPREDATRGTPIANSAPPALPVAGNKPAPLSSRLPRKSIHSMTANDETASVPLTSLGVNTTLRSTEGALSKQKGKKDSSVNMDSSAKKEDPPVVLPAVSKRYSSGSNSSVPSAPRSPSKGGAAGAVERDAQRSTNSYSAVVPLLPITPSNHRSQTATAQGEATTPLGGAVSARDEVTLCLYGRYVSPDLVECAKDSLNFNVPSTKEKGVTLPPTRVTLTAMAILRCPEEAAFMAFLSNQMPLMLRNHHAGAHLPPQGLLLPHHGFAFYTEDGRLVGVLSLRCGSVGSLVMDSDEFVVLGKPMPPFAGSQAMGRQYAAAYFTHNKALNVMPQPVMDGGHSGGSLPSPTDPQLLTFSSAQHLVGNFTPLGSPGTRDIHSATRNSEEQQLYSPARSHLPDLVLPICWMGFDADRGALVLSGVDQRLWFPFLVR